MASVTTMGKRGDARKGDIFERRVRELLAAGYCTSRISAETGKSYIHTVRIVERIRNEPQKVEK